MKKAKRVAEILRKDFWFQFFSIVSVGLIVASFILPPLGIIEPSVMAGVGEVFAFGALYEVHRAIDKGYDTTVSHNQTSITITNNDDDREITVTEKKNEDTDRQEMEEI